MVERLANGPKPIVEYFPGSGTLYVANGKPLGEADGFAQRVVPFFNRTNQWEVVAICFEGGATYTLKPFLDAVLSERGLGPIETPAKTNTGAASRTSSINAHAEPRPQVTYNLDEGCLRVANGHAEGEAITIAEGVVAFYDEENPGGIAGLRIGPDAKVILKPFVDAALAKYGKGPGEATRGPVKPAS